MIVIKADPGRVEEVAFTGGSPIEDAIDAVLWTATATGAPNDLGLVPLFRTDSAFSVREGGFVIVIKTDPGRVEEVAFTGGSLVEDAINAALWPATATGTPNELWLVPLFRTDSAFSVREVDSRSSSKQIQVRTRISLNAGQTPCSDQRCAVWVRWSAFRSGGRGGIQSWLQENRQSN